MSGFQTTVEMFLREIFREVSFYAQKLLEQNVPEYMKHQITHIYSSLLGGPVLSEVSLLVRMLKLDDVIWQIFYILSGVVDLSRFQE